jgi:hypothetical protein
MSVQDLLLTKVRLKQLAVDNFNQHGAIYVICLMIEGELWTYVGQTGNAWKRIADGHNRASYRSLSKRSFLYWLWDQADDLWICLAASGDQLASGPILNLLEQWVAVLFLALQPQELASNLPKEIFATIPHQNLQWGVGIREPLAEGFGLRDFPMKGSPFDQAGAAMKRRFYAYKKAMPVPDRAAPYLSGDLFDGDYHPHGRQYRFHFGRLQFEIKRDFVDSLKQDTIWIQCELVPVGEVHRNEIVKGANYAMYIVWDDPSRRLGIRLGGLRWSDGRPDEVWVKKGGDFHNWLAKMNFLVDWLEGRDLTEARPRRWYPGAEGSRGQGSFTRHPIDFLADSGEDELFGDDWDLPVDPKAYKTWYEAREV